MNKKINKDSTKGADKTKETVLVEKTIKEEPKKGMITISPVELKAMKDSISALQKSNDLLLSVADKKSLGHYFQKNSKKEANVVKLRAINGKLIIGWMSTKDVVQKVGQNRWVEDQQVKVLYEDGTSEEMRMVDFELNHTKIKCQRVGVIKNEETGKVAYRLKRIDNLKEYTVGVQFVN